MGEVLRVRDPDLDRVLAVKIIANPRNDPAVHAKFLREARMTGQLQHPAIVPVHELGYAEDGRRSSR